MARKGPPRAAGNVDALFIFLLIVSGLMTLLIFTAVVYFAARYRHRKGVLAEQIEGSTPARIDLVDHPALRLHGDLCLGRRRLLQEPHATSRFDRSLRRRQTMDVEAGTRRRPARNQ